MKILVTGAAGFIGSHLCGELLDSGIWESVVGIDNFDPFYDRKVKQANLERIYRKGFKFVDRDIRGRMPVFFEAYGPFDTIVHLAAKAGVRPSIEDPVGYAETNIQGTANLLAEAEKQEARFVFASSSSVYGNDSKTPFGESDPAIQPISPYAATKRAGELLCVAHHEVHRRPVTILRLFTVYGPGQRPDLAIEKYIRLILEGKPVQRYGNGSTSRDYTYIDDITWGIRRAIERQQENTCEIINLGSGFPITLNQTIWTVGQACGREVEIEFMETQPGDVSHTLADISKAKRMLGYGPRFTFAEGVSRQVGCRK